MTKQQFKKQLVKLIQQYLREENPMKIPYLIEFYYYTDDGSGVSYGDIQFISTKKDISFKIPTIKYDTFHKKK
jgi:hypothetical protein